MADHLKLPPHIAILSKRPSGRPIKPPPFDRRGHATTLRGILEGLESANAGLFDDADADDDEPDANEMGEVVFKFTGSKPFPPSAFGQFEMIPLAADGERHFFVLSTVEARRKFREIAEDYDVDPDNYHDIPSWRAVVENIAGVELYGRDDRVAPGVRRPEGDATVDLDLVLWPTSFTVRGAKAVAERRVGVIRSLVEAFGERDERVQVLAYDIEPDNMMAHVRVNAEAYDAVVEHPYIEAVRGPLTVLVSADHLKAGSAPAQAPLPEGAPIGIIDDLVVDANPWLQDVVVEQRNFPNQTFGPHTKHGTQVAGLAAWGDCRNLLLDPAYDGSPHPLYVARVAQANQDLAAQLVENSAQQISDAMDWLAECGVKVVVCAFGLSYPDDGAVPSDLSAVIDRKAAEHDQVVVVSAGNVEDAEGLHWKNDYPEYLLRENAGIAAPGTAALGLTVGSIAHSDVFERKQWPGGVKISPVGSASAFTRTGPSRGGRSAGRLKPEVAAHGGAWAWDQHTSSAIDKDPNLSAITLIPPSNGRLFAAATGTSYAAPLVAHEVANIATRYPDASANLLRALTALSGQEPKAPKDGEPKVGYYGTPDASRILESGGNRAVFVYEGEMSTNSYALLELPVPGDFAAGASHREVRIALAFDPPVRRSRRDYIAGKMHFTLSHKASLPELRNVLKKQPTAKEVAADPSLTKYDGLGGMKFLPPRTHFAKETIICRTYNKPQRGWDTDDGPYYIVITHDHSPWTTTQKKDYTSQRFAIAITMEDFDRSNLDIHTLAQAQLQARARGQAGGPR